MGMQAIVVYDAVKYQPLVLRASSSAEFSKAVQALASFTQHIEDVASEAATPTNVSALWEGPPQVTYDIVGKRYRVLVLWKRSIAELDVAVRVVASLRKVSSAVEGVLQALNREYADAVQHLYDTAGECFGYPRTGGSDPDAIVKNSRAGEGLRGLIKKSSATLGLQKETRKSGKRSLTSFFGKGGKVEQQKLSSEGSLTKTEGRMGLIGNNDNKEVSRSKVVNTSLLDALSSTHDLGALLPPTSGNLDWFVDLFEKPTPETQIRSQLTDARRASVKRPAVKADKSALPINAGNSLPSSSGPLQINSSEPSSKSIPKASDTALSTSNSVDALKKEPAESAQPTTGVPNSVRGQMNAFAQSMQAGNFQLALQQVQATLQNLAKTNPRQDKEILTCSNYLIAQKILVRVRAIEKESASLLVGSPELRRRNAEAAVLTMVLASLKHMLPRHRIAAVKMAVQKNLAVENFGICSGWIERLLEKAPAAQKSVLLQKLQLCKQENNRNATMPPYNRLCYLTLSLIPPPVLTCDFCPATYSPSLSGVVANQVCPTCLVGRIILAPR